MQQITGGRRSARVPRDIGKHTLRESSAAPVVGVRIGRQLRRGDGVRPGVLRSARRPFQNRDTYRLKYLCICYDLREIMLDVRAECRRTGRGCCGTITKRVALSAMHPDLLARNICCHRGRYPGVCVPMMRPGVYGERGALMQRCCTESHVFAASKCSCFARLVYSRCCV
jgi:hypothetical protein